MTTTTPLQLDITPLSATIGAELRGVDLKQTRVGRQTIAEIRAALLRYKVIFFPGQHLGPAEHVAFAAALRRVHARPPGDPGHQGLPGDLRDRLHEGPRVTKSSSDTGDRYDGLSWHTDVTFVEHPPLGSILNALVIPDAGGDTMFSDHRAAYEALSETFRGFLDGLVAVHDGSPRFAKCSPGATTAAATGTASSTRPSNRSSTPWSGPIPRPATRACS